MTRHRPFLVHVAFWLAGLIASPVLAQQIPFPFELRVTQGDNTFTVANGSGLNFVADAVGEPISARVDVVYTGQQSATFASQPVIIGSGAFTVSQLEGLPIVLGQRQELSFRITFTPTSTDLASAQMNLNVVVAPAGSSEPPISGVIQFALTGAAPDLSVSYALQTDGNVIPLPSGGTLDFGLTQVNTPEVATVIVVNRGSGEGTVNSITVTGDAFQPLGIPLLPATLAAGASLQFRIRYTPEGIGTDSGALAVALGDTEFTAVLTGAGVGSTFRYEIVVDGVPRPISPDQPVNLPATAVGENVSTTVRVSNTGSAVGLINVIGVSGASFGLEDLPFLPAELPAGQALTFSLVFAPVEPGDLKGRLRIGNDVFDLTGVGIGTQFSFSYGAGGIETRVRPGESVIFSPLAVGVSSSVTFRVRNDGTQPAPIASIGISGSREIFRLENVPGLPLTLEPRQTLSFTIVFTPANTTLATAQLLIDALAFTLSGFGTDPVPLPAYQFAGAAGTVGPAEQPAIGLSLAEPYPLTLTGSLVITVDPEGFVDDPAVQFSTGGRSVAFTVPANTREALFPNGSNLIRLQTGTVAAAIVIRPSFATQSGLDLTPAAPATLRLAVARAAPVLRTIRLTASGANSLQVEVAGFSTTRAVTGLAFVFTPVTGSNVARTEFSLDVTSEAAFWFGSNAASAFGGQFAAAVPFTLTSSRTGDIPLAAIQSISVTATNEVGVSNALAVQVR